MLVEDNPEPTSFDLQKVLKPFETSNYHNLIRLIDENPYQIFALGHSCGLSDRTMLNMAFEHEYCKSVKVFYYQNGSFNNYIPITQEISRHFSNKQQMRKKIIPFDRSTPMSQAGKPALNHKFNQSLYQKKNRFTD